MRMTEEPILERQLRPSKREAASVYVVGFWKSRLGNGYFRRWRHRQRDGDPEHNILHHRHGFDG